MAKAQQLIRVTAVNGRIFQRPLSAGNELLHYPVHRCRASQKALRVDAGQTSTKMNTWQHYSVHGKPLG